MTLKESLRVGLYLHDEKANVEKYVRALKSWRMVFASVYPEDLPDLESRGIDVLLLHGGWYGIDRTPPQNQSEFETTPEKTLSGDAVRSFVKRGGGVVGVCCGAFNVVWMGLIEAEISRMAGVGPHALEVVDDAHPIAAPMLQRTENRSDRKWHPIPCVRVNGPVFFPNQPSQMVFSYDWEKRLGAVLAGDYGDGRAVAISPHPEMTMNEVGREMRDEPLAPVSMLLREALLWAAAKPTS